MKKLLLGSTALVVGGVMAAPAMAADPIKMGLGATDQRAPIFCERAEVYLSMGRSHQALIDLNHAIKLNSADARAYLLRAHAYKQLGDFTHELKDSAMAKELGAKVRGQVAPQPLTD